MMIAFMLLMSFILIIIVVRGCDYCWNGNTRHIYECMMEKRRLLYVNLARSNAIKFALQTTSSGTYYCVVFRKQKRWIFRFFCSPDSFKYNITGLIFFYIRKKRTKNLLCSNAKSMPGKEVSFNGTIYLILEGAYAVAYIYWRFNSRPCIILYDM